jgi:NAD(P)-dependent dehydrogenase (short-subunit alcohol dehydrogenase family)
MQDQTAALPQSVLDPRLEGRRVVVCGAAGGIGAAAVQELHGRGARVAAIFNSTPPAEHLAGLARWYQGDLSDKAAVDSLFDEIARDLGGIDALIQPAGTWREGTPEDADEAQIDFLVGMNFKSTVFTNQAAHRHMQGKGGSIVNFGSVEGVEGAPRSAVYAATRGAVHAWTRSAARAWGPDGITVNAIAPIMMTPLTERAFATMSPAEQEGMAAALREKIPIGGKFGNPLRDCAPVLAFLVSPDSHFITGQLISVDGGFRMLGA